ncbi:MAG: SPOR domain-containing protein [Gammaproteobacteria bacterium]|nr:SPOR domain-containing protein [Gammaproteobacteria bacterium]
MARKRQSGKRKARKSSSGIGIFVMGLIVGSIGTVLGMNYFDQSPLNGPGSGIGSLLKQPTQRVQSDSEPQKTSVTETIPDFKFDYHELLLEEEYVLPLPSRDRTEVADVPEQSTTETDSTATAETTESVAATELTSSPQPTAEPAVEPGTAFVIQIGSYRSFEDADRIKATLALTGSETYIQKVSIEGRGDFYRVRMGPFREYDAVERAVDTVTDLNIKPLVFRVKTSG